MHTEFNNLAQLISFCLIKDRFAFSRQLQTLKQRHKQKKPVDQAWDKLVANVQASIDKVKTRTELVPSIEYDDALPISQKRAEISKAIAENQVVVIAGETGSGKTTQIPKMCLELGLSQYGQIAHTQPRRIAARSVAQRIADEVHTPLGEQVGYQVRFSDNSTDSTLVKLMTDGILLAETQRDRFLNKYQVIIIDEAHERSLNIDFLLGYLKQLLPKRPDLKVIITSATIDVQRFSEHFSDAPFIEVSGRTFPVEERYRPLIDLNKKEDEESEGDLNQGIIAAVEELEIEDSKRGQIGDVLIFLSGEREIREASLELKKANLKHADILPLYARLNSSEQNKIFNPKGGKRRIILSTNVAETSLTVPGIRYVIDSGVARISRYSYRSKVQRLPIERISKASANQRKGRCGRVSEGICIRLYDEDDFASRPEFSEPEIQRTNLAAVILQMLSLKLGNVDEFPFLDKPDGRFIKDGFNLLNYMRMREWRDVHYQLRLQCKELDLKENDNPAGYTSVHQSILSGMLSHVGQKTEEGDYKGARNRKFMLFPGSGIFKKRPKWVVSAELVETSRLYGRMNAKIEPEWLEPLAKNLIKKKYLEPFWSTKRGQVMAYEQVSLYGLIIVPKRTVGYGKIDPAVSREMFIREALVQSTVQIEGQASIQSEGDFLQYNKKLIAEVSELEDKSRRRDIVVDEERLYQFYAERLPEDICSTASFETWRKTQPNDLLHVKKSFLMQHDAENITQGQFPDHFTHGNTVYPLSYRFEPGHHEDGVSVMVPAAMLKQLPVGRLQWLVPGMLRDKVIMLLKSLPKSIRKQLVPVPDFSDEFILYSSSQPETKEQSLLDAISQFVYKQKRIKIAESDWGVEQIDLHYLMNIKVFGANDKELIQGRHWQALVDEIGEQADVVMAPQKNDLERNGIVQWDLNELPEEYESQQAGINITMYPALIDEKSSVSLKLLMRADEAELMSRLGVYRLLQLELTEQVNWLHKEIQKGLVQEIIYYGQLGNKTELLASMTELVFKVCFKFDSIPRSEEEYMAIKQQRESLGAAFDQVLPVIKEVLKSYHQLNKKLKQSNQLAFALATSDIKYQLGILMPKQFMRIVDFDWLKHYPRYFKAITIRLDKLQGNLQKDKLMQLKVMDWQSQYQELVSKLPTSLECYPEVLALNWMMQEYRVSLFAQDLRTSIPVSDKRWKAQMELAKASIQQ